MKVTSLVLLIFFAQVFAAIAGKKKTISDLNCLVIINSFCRLYGLA